MYPKRGSAPDPIMCNKKDADEKTGTHKEVFMIWR